MNFMNRLYGPNMELIHPRIAKLWAKEKCNAQMQRQGQKVRNMLYFMNRLYCPNKEVIQPRIAKLWAK
jgi:hypothetical protein